MSWDKLSLRERAEYIKTGVKNGLTNIDDIKGTYNEFAKGGHIYDGTTESSQQMDRPYRSAFDGSFGLKDALKDFSASFMQMARGNQYGAASDRFYLSSLKKEDPERDGGTAQRTYLLPREIQRKEFLDSGYIIGKEGDYGLVRTAVGDRDLPIYQTAPDENTRDNLIPIGNGNTDWKGDSATALYHAGNYPTAYYVDGITGEYYQKAWDLNDYGPSSIFEKKKGSSASRYDLVRKVASKGLDLIGSPVVVTTGFQSIPASEEVVNMDAAYRKSKGLVPMYSEEATEYLNKYGYYPFGTTPMWTLPELVVTSKKK